MPNNTRTEATLITLKTALAVALETGTDTEVLAARRAISRFYRGQGDGLGITGLADTRRG